jgi:hypothetical protein
MAAKGLKINNQNSTAPKPKEPDKVAFENAAKGVFNKEEEYKKRALDLATKLKSLITDKTLPENQTLITKDIEIEVISKLILFATELNNDENKKEGEGSVALSMLTFKMLILQRDQINTMGYKIEKLEKANVKLEQMLKSLTETKEKV